MKTLVAVDVGNTSIHMARYTQGRWRFRRRVPTEDFKKSALAGLSMVLPKNKDARVVIASVVPDAGKYLENTIPKKLGVPAHLIGPKFPVPIKNLYKSPRQVGVDRLLNGLAAFEEIHGAVIVLDFGTAITFDVISKKGDYLGGVIAPGIEISLEALFQKTALLPNIRLQHPKRIIGADTVESIRVGCSVGIGGLCDRIVEEIERKSHFRSKVIATGGYARFMSKYCRRISSIDPDLIFKGILLTDQYHFSK